MIDSGDPIPCLAAKAKAGDKRTFEQLIGHHKTSLYRLVRSYVGDPDDAYDVLQDTFVAAWLALHRYDAARDFGAWLRTIALNKCRDFGRRRTIRRRLLGLFASESQTAPSAPPPSPADDAEERLKRLDAAIAALPAFYKEPLLLVSIAGLSHREAAEQLKTSPKAIEMRIRRAKTKLSETLTVVFED